MVPLQPMMNLVLLTIKCKWLEAIVHVTQFEFLDLLHPKQVQLFISIRIHGKFHLSTTFALVGFQENIQQFIPQSETNLKDEVLLLLQQLFLMIMSNGM